MSKKILIIESDKTFSSTLAKHLTEAGYNVSSLDDTTNILSSIEATKPDLIFLNAVLSPKTGSEILNELSTIPALRSIPAIAISDTDEPNTISTILGSGAYDYIIKNKFEPSEVITKIHHLLKDKDSSQVNPEMHESLKGKKLLWVEDDQFLGNIIKQKFILLGLDITYVTTGEEALKSLEEKTYDMVILDLLLPNMNGFEVLEKIKSSEKTKNIPAVILSNLGQAPDIEKARQLGAALFLIKAEHSLDEVIRFVTDLIKKNENV